MARFRSFDRNMAKFLSVVVPYIKKRTLLKRFLFKQGICLYVDIVCIPSFALKTTSGRETGIVLRIFGSLRIFGKAVGSNFNILFATFSANTLPNFFGTSLLHETEPQRPKTQNNACVKKYEEYLQMILHC